MPFYEYACTSCGKQTTILQKISDAPAVECPSCHALALTKQISAAGFRLKGGGWYETDFKSDNKKNLAGDAGDSGAKPESTKTDSTSSAKGESGKKSDSGEKSSPTPAPAAAPAASTPVPAKPTTPAST